LTPRREGCDPSAGQRRAAARLDVLPAAVFAGFCADSFAEDLVVFAGLWADSFPDDLVVFAGLVADSVGDDLDVVAGLAVRDALAAAAAGRPLSGAEEAAAAPTLRPRPRSTGSRNRPV
jgi:hypothetical protein